jgi:S1-C subfamily serine protease
MRALILATLMLLAGCSGNAVELAHQSAVLLSMDDGTCSATIIGPHAILTAEHCLSATTHLAINNHPVEVVKVLLDGKDHAIVIVRVTFKQWADIGPAPRYGQPIFDLGNPGDLRDVYRHGYVAGPQVVDGQTFILLDFEGWYGDSGSGIFNEYGQLIGVVSFITVQIQGAAIVKFMGAFPMEFTPQQWAQV